VSKKVKLTEAQIEALWAVRRGCFLSGVSASTFKALHDKGLIRSEQSGGRTVPTVEGMRALGEALGIDDIDARVDDLVAVDKKRIAAQGLFSAAMDAYELARANWSSASRALDRAIEEAWEDRRPR